MFDFEDFEKDEDFYKNLDFNIEDIDFGDFPSCLMIVTSALKSLDFKNSLQSGHHMMMRLFNMTGLEITEENEDVFNIIMSLLSHLFALLRTMEDTEKYFNYFDNAIIYPMTNLKGNDG